MSFDEVNRILLLILFAAIIGVFSAMWMLLKKLIKNA